MAALDSSIVNISMPTITKSFDSSMATTNWIITIYLLTLSGTLLIFGKISDLMGRKVIFTSGMVIFTISSLTCGLAGSLAMLIVSRFVQALGGAMIMANSPAIITEVFPPSERGKALGTIGTVVALGIMTGSPLGGKIVSALTWRYIFFINIPVGIAGIVMSIILIRENSKAKEIEAFDFLGAAFLLIFMTTFLLALNIGARRGFSLRNVQIMFIVALVFFVIFIFTELKVKGPTIELRLFKNAGFSSTNIAALSAYMTIFMMIFMMPFFLERVKGLNPGLIGVILITPTIMLFIFSPVFGWVSDKIGFRLLRCTGLSLMTVSMMFLSRINIATEVSSIVLTLLLYGFGIGMFMPPNNSLLMGSVPKDKLGTAAGMLATTRNIGMMMGVSTASAIFTYRYNKYSMEFSGDELLRLSLPYTDVFFAAAIVCAAGIVAAFLQGRINGDG
jgi:EmrB/QacA subfamily drug resistance transporter